MLKTSTRFTVTQSVDDADETIQLADETDRKIIVPGKSLEAQFQTARGEFLFVLTDDCPLEETLRVTLVSQDLAIVDQLDFTTAYQSLIVDSVTLRGENSIELICAGQRSITVKLLERPLNLLARIKASLKGSKVSRQNRILLNPSL